MSTAASPDRPEASVENPDSEEYVNPDWDTQEEESDEEELDTEMALRDVDPESEERDDDDLPTDTSDHNLQMDFSAMNDELFNTPEGS